MTKLLQRAFAALERMPPEAQDEIARALLGVAEAGDDVDDLEEVEPEHRAAVEEARAQAERGAFADRDALEIVAGAFRRER